MHRLDAQAPPYWRLAFVAALWFIVLLVALPSPEEATARTTGPAQARKPSGRHRVFVTIDPFCPICISYAPTLRDLATTLDPSLFELVLVVASPEISADTLALFLDQHKIRAKTLFDTTHQLIEKYGLTITPEVALVDSDSLLVYRGRIDNRYDAPGRRRRVITTHDLLQVLERVKSGQKPPVGRTKAVGCIIEPLR